MKKRVLYAMPLLIGSIFFGGCSAPNFPNLSSFVYSDADKYIMGDAELPAEGIESVDIDWVSGEINVEYHSENMVTISETANKSLNDNTTMYYLVDGNTLRIKFAKSGKRVPSKLSKELTVYLPEGMELNEIIVDSVSADVNVSGLKTEDTKIDTTSGDIVFEDVTLSGQAKFDTTSGDITAELDGTLTLFSADTVSGDMEFTLAAAKTVKLDSTSGEIQFTMKEMPDRLSADTVSGDIDLSLPGAGELELNSTSGQIKLSAQKAPDALSIDTISGDVVLCLPKNADFTVNWDSVSGSLSSDLAMKKDGDSYIFGSGTRQYDVDTTSGDLTIDEY